MGMERMFNNGAEFTELLDQPENLKVSKVVHKAFIEVNEEGAEAAAATGRICLTAFTALCINLCFMFYAFFASFMFLRFVSFTSSIYYLRWTYVWILLSL